MKKISYGTFIKRGLRRRKKQFSELINIQKSDFRLEQIEYKKTEKIWEVVVSYLVENKNISYPSDLAITNLAIRLSNLPYERVYKRLIIDENKEVLGIYMFSEAG
ncbi:hypothetical protein [Algoriphagus hitonicola]|uniref:hypothetical protein n=1 Tax=Algoriphagus hitonicola TaxID=435880 RepID=UPI000B898732|nr:hypothetical protein [Algoriphagus hitonicola]